MATIPPELTIGYAQEQLSRWLTALEAASSGSSYSIGGRTLTRRDVTEIRAEIQRWHNSVLAFKARYEGKSRPLGATAAFAAPGAGSGAIIPQGLWTDYRT